MKSIILSLFVLSFSLLGAEPKVVTINKIQIRGELGSYRSSLLAYIPNQDGHVAIEIDGQMISATLCSGKAESFDMPVIRKDRSKRKEIGRMARRMALGISGMRTGRSRMKTTTESVYL